MTASLFTCQKSATASKKACNLNVAYLDGGSAILSGITTLSTGKPIIFYFYFHASQAVASPHRDAGLQTQAGEYIMPFPHVKPCLKIIYRLDRALALTRTKQ